MTPIFGENKFFQSIWLGNVQLHKVFWQQGKINKTNDPISRKHPDRQKSIQKDRNTLFYRTLSSTTAEDWHLKVKDTEYNVDLTKHYCIITSMQKISSVLRLILKIQQILGSHELNRYDHF